MSADGKIATRTGDSQWISNAASRTLVHQLRGRMDGVAVGVATALADDPLLTARPPGPREALRIVFDTHARLPITCQLVRTAREHPVLLATAEAAPAERLAALSEAGVELLLVPTDDETGSISLPAALAALGRRAMSNLLVEGGGRLLGSLFDAQLVDEIHAFVAPLILGGEQAVSPVCGQGVPRVRDADRWELISNERLGGDMYLRWMRPRRWE
jgi:diaminohydroxyphosphoribosylaminopyrimidine deaminase/5-amino-6-(5-phosphoribosylamino)uracil reductase